MQLPATPANERLTTRRDSHAPQRARAMARAFMLEGLVAVERLVLAVLLGHADPAGRAWPLLEELAARVGLEGGARSVARVLERLQVRGLVDRVTVSAGELLPTGQAASTARALVTLRLPSPAACLGGAAELLELALSPELALRPAARAVLAVYCLHASAAREAWPSHARVAKLAGVSVRTVGSSLFLLRSMGVLERARIAPGAKLPNDQTATQWKSLVTLLEQGLRQATAPRRSCRASPTVDPSPPDPGSEESLQGSEITESRERARPSAPPQGAASRPPVTAPPAPGCGAVPLGPADEQVSDLLLRFSERCETDDLGRAPADVMRARLADGFSAADIRDAIEGVALNPWRMALRSRRWVRSVFGDAKRFRTHLEAGRGPAHDLDLLEQLPPPPAPVVVDQAERARQRAQLSAFLGAGPRSFFVSSRPTVDAR